MKETVCVTGGSGGIGQALLEQLVDVFEVKALFRVKTETTDHWERRGCTPVWGDLANEEALAELVKDAKFVFHCAALVTQAAYAESYAVNVEGTRRLFRIAAAAGCQRFVYVSSIAVYSNAANGKQFTEDLPLRETDDMAVYSLTKLQSENALRELGKGSSLEYVILRPTCVYGPRTKSYTLVPLDLIRKGLPVILGSGHGLLDVVYVDDVATALLLAARSPGAAGEVFNIGHETITFNDFYAHYGEMLHRPIRHVPTFIVSKLARLLRSRQLRNGVGFLVRMSENSQPYPSSKAQAVLGYGPKIDLSHGMLRTEVWAKSRGLAPITPYFLEGYGTLLFRPLAVTHPESEEQLVEVVRMAAKYDVKVRAAGSLHSQCPLPDTEGICVVPNKYNNVLSIEADLVTVQAGMKLTDLNNVLAASNLALPILGAITAQTVSGAISTATHGGSIHYGSLSDCIESLRIIRADGSIVDIGRSHDLFGAAAVAMGLLGIISTVTFRCVPAFTLQSQSCVKKASEVLESFDEINENNLYVDMLYFPITDDIEILAINRTETEPERFAGSQKPESVGKPPSAAQARVQQRLKIPVLKALAWLVRRTNSIQRHFTRKSVGSSYRPRTGRSDLVLAFGDQGSSTRTPGIIGDMELAIPYEHARTAIGVLRDHFRKSGKFPLFPIHIRCSPPSDLWLSPAYRRKVCWMEFYSYPRTDPFFKDMHELLRPFEYRFHWGKETAADREYIEQRYDKWHAFARLRTEWDSRGVFLNRYLESFFSSR